jgi:hypothetical protein
MRFLVETYISCVGAGFKPARFIPVQGEVLRQSLSVYAFASNLQP